MGANREGWRKEQISGPCVTLILSAAVRESQSSLRTMSKKAQELAYWSFWPLAFGPAFWLWQLWQLWQFLSSSSGQFSCRQSGANFTHAVYPPLSI